ncbi:hypothetical protein ACSBR1_012444 [Camellia fascicularis]
MATVVVSQRVGHSNLYLVSWNQGKGRRRHKKDERHALSKGSPWACPWRSPQTAASFRGSSHVSVDGKRLGRTTSPSVVAAQAHDWKGISHQPQCCRHASFAKDPFRVFSAWNSSLNFCKWQGVTCSHRHHQRASALNLSSLKLVGSLSPHIGNLTFLRVINLKNNSFHGVIPQEVGRLFRIRYLILGNNSFEGEFPVNVIHCSDLRVINLINNNLGGKVPTQLVFLPKLYELVLSLNHFFGTIPPTLGNISALRFFNMSNNNLEGQTPIELGKLSNLEELQLSENKLNSMIPPAILNISSINILALVSNQLHGSLPSNLGLTLLKLERIYMGENQFSGTIPASLVNASRLGVIDLGSNSLTGGIPQNLGELKQLELLNFGANTLGTAKSNDLQFLTSLTNCSNLSVLRLHANQLGGVLPTLIANLSTKLIRLRLDQNYIS